ncbi:MAG: DUF3168 domain-containing protein [Rhizobiaceae bacterium]
MSAAAAELQRAVYQALAGDATLTGLLGGPDIFDHTPPSASFPYITFGTTGVFAWDTSTETGSEVLFALHAWSRARGRGEVLAIMEAIATRLDDAALTVSGYELVRLGVEDSETGYDDDVAVHHGVMRLRAILEPAA